MGRKVVKASGIVNLTDARYFAAQAVDYLTFHLEPGSPDYADPLVLRAIREWVEGPAIFGSFSQSSVAEVILLADTLGLDGLVLSWSEYGEVLHQLKGRVLMLEVDKLPAGRPMEEVLREIDALVTYFILPVSVETDLDWLRTLCAEFPVLLKFQGDGLNVVDILRFVEPVGIDLEGGAEERVGVKSFDALEDIFNFLETDQV
jgi:phosphoribosylanthranilate isomerase